MVQEYNIEALRKSIAKITVKSEQAPKRSAKADGNNIFSDNKKTTNIAGVLGNFLNSFSTFFNTIKVDFESATEEYNKNLESAVNNNKYQINPLKELIEERESALNFAKEETINADKRVQEAELELNNAKNSREKAQEEVIFANEALKNAREASQKQTNDLNKQPIQENLNNVLDKLFDIDDTNNIKIKNGVAGKTTTENFQYRLNSLTGRHDTLSKSWSTKATVAIASLINPESEKLKELNGTLKFSDLTDLAEEIPQGTQPNIGDIVLTGKDGITHSGVVVGYTEEGKVLVVEGNSAKANGGAAIVEYDINNKNEKSILKYIQMSDKEEPDTEPIQESIKDAEEKLQKAKEKLKEAEEIEKKAENNLENSKVELENAKKNEEEIQKELIALSKISKAEIEDIYLSDKEISDSTEEPTEEEKIEIAKLAKEKVEKLEKEKDSALEEYKNAENELKASQKQTNDLNKQPIQENLNNVLDKLFDIDDTNNIKIKNGVAGKTTTENFQYRLNSLTGRHDTLSKSWSTKATVAIASLINPNSEKLKELNGTLKFSDLTDLAEEIPQGTQPNIGDIVLTGKDGITHSGVVVGYTEDGKILVAEGNSAKANGGAAIVEYDINNKNEKSILKYIQMSDKEEPDTEPIQESIKDAEEKLQKAKEKLNELNKQITEAKAEAEKAEKNLKKERPENYNPDASIYESYLPEDAFFQRLDKGELTDDTVGGYEEFEKEYINEFAAKNLKHITKDSAGNIVVNYNIIEAKLDEYKKQTDYSTIDSGNNIYHYDKEGKLLYIEKNGENSLGKRVEKRYMYEYDSQGKLSHCTVTEYFDGNISEYETIYDYNEDEVRETKIGFNIKPKCSSFTLESNEQIDDDVTQGKIGDCYYVVSAYGICKTEKGSKAIDNAINRNEDGDFVVSLYDSRNNLKHATITRNEVFNAMIVDSHTLRNKKELLSLLNSDKIDENQYKEELGHANNDLDMWLLEIAYNKIYTGKESNSKQVTQQGFYLNDEESNILVGGNLSKFTQALFGKKAQEIETSNRNTIKATDKTINWIRKYGTNIGENAVADLYVWTINNKIGYCKDVNGKTIVLCPKENTAHALSILKYNKSTDTILVREPNKGETYEISLSELGSLAIGMGYFDLG